MIGRLVDLAARAVLGIAGMLFAVIVWRSRSRRADTGPSPQGQLVPAQSTGGIRSWLILGATLLALTGFGGSLVVVSGVVPIKASSGHWSITSWFLTFAKRRSVATHTLGIKSPELDELRLVTQGAAQYDSACRPCHGSPGLDQPRIARQMTPRPPDLRASVPQYEPEELFYIVKHGIKLTGMPAWPAAQRDDEVWAMIAFLQRFPTLDARTYEELATGRHSPADAGDPMEDLLGPQQVPEAIAANCSRCHGTDGLGRGAGAFPLLAGQRPSYLFATLRAYARGERHSGIMEPVAAVLGLDEMQEIAQYYAARSERTESAAKEGAMPEIERGRTIATNGLPDQLVPACVKCHGPGDHRRNPNYPRLAGQYAEYITLQLTLFKSDRRGGTAYQDIMRKVARQLTEEQMRAVARYYSSLAESNGSTP